MGNNFFPGAIPDTAKIAFCPILLKNKVIFMENLAMFDLDGTLIDTSDLLFEGIPHVIKEFLGINVAKEEYIDLWGLDINLIFTRFAKRANKYSSRKIDAMFSFYEDWYIKNHAKYVKPYEGIREVLEFLKHDKYMKIGIVTTRTLKRANMAYDLEWGHLIDFVVGGDMVAHKKPAPDSINFAVESLNAQAGSHFFIGDNKSDILAAKSSSYKVASLGALWGAEHPADLKSENPDKVFTDPHSFYHWLASEYHG